MRLLPVVLLLAVVWPASITLANVSTGDGSWSWQNPIPQGNDLFAVHFTDLNTGWAVGARGLILRTTDGGANWAIQESGIRHALFGIAARDSSAAVAVGGGGTILTTSDGGATWLRRTGAGSDQINAVRYADDRTIYAVGREGVFLKSDDGGDTWDRSQPLGEINFADVQFLDATNGYVLSFAPTEGFPLFATSDGGNTWRAIGMPAGKVPRALAFSDRSTGVAVGEGGFILKTTDGGTTWREVPAPASLSLFSVTYTDPNVVHAVGDGGMMLRSLDGGDSWQVLPDPRPSSAILRSVAFVNPNVGYAAGYNGTILRTTNAGASWSPVAGGPRSGLRSVQAVSAELAVAVGTGGVVVKSGDGGASWRAVASGTDRDLNAVRFLNSALGFIVGDGGIILRTTDGGETWQALSSPVARSLTAIGLAGPRGGARMEAAIVVGEANLVLRSTDQGNTWSQVSLPGPSDQLIYAHFPEPTLGYIGGLQTVWQSTDAGQTWRIVAGGDKAERPPADPLGFSFPSRNVGFMVGLHGQIFRSDDAGASWGQQNSRTRAALRDVDFLDPNIGYVVGDSGTLLLTTNGGESWNAVNAGTHLNLWSVQFLDRSLGLAVGEGGAILRTTTGGLAVRNLPPAVLSVSPQDSQTNVAADERIRIVFDADMQFRPGDYEAGRVQLRGPDGALVESGVAYDVSTRELVILPVRPLTLGSTYTIRLPAGGLIDLEGRGLANEVTTTFQTVCSIAMQTPFRRLMAAEPGVRSHLGCPSAAERTIRAEEETFERGHILWRADSGLLVVSFDDGQWATFPDLYDPGEPLEASAEENVPLPEGYFVPTGRFLRMWRYEPGIFDRLGFAISPARGFQGVVQDFAGGEMLWTGEGGWVRVLYDDGTHAAYPDPDRPR
jgi:photosystem II stability/assembly factor-like uncharacterized protein